MTTIWNHRLGSGSRAAALPALFLTTNYQTATREAAATYAASLQHQCVYRTQDPVINKFSIFFTPQVPSPTSKDGKGWCGISVCLCLLLYKAARLSAPQTQATAQQPRKFQFHERHVATCQVGLRFRGFVWVFLPAPGSQLMPPGARVRPESLCAT